MDSDRKPKRSRSERSRERVLSVASDLFYRNGVRAVGMDQIVETSGMAKTTIYRHFPTKDSLIEAFLEAEDAEFWLQWDAVIRSAGDGKLVLDALAIWVGQKVQREGYRGCPQINVAAEFADPAHPARGVARRHKAEMLRRLELICTDIGAIDPSMAALRIATLLDGAFTSAERLAQADASTILRDAVRRLV